MRSAIRLIVSVVVILSLIVAPSAVLLGGCVSSLSIYFGGDHAHAKRMIVTSRPSKEENEARSQ